MELRHQGTNPLGTLQLVLRWSTFKCYLFYQWFWRYWLGIEVALRSYYLFPCWSGTIHTSAMSKGNLQVQMLESFNVDDRADMDRINETTSWLSNKIDSKVLPDSKALAFIVEGYPYFKWAYHSFSPFFYICCPYSPHPHSVALGQFK